MVYVIYIPSFQDTRFNPPWFTLFTSPTYRNSGSAHRGLHCLRPLILEAKVQRIRVHAKSSQPWFTLSTFPSSKDPGSANHGLRYLRPLVLGAQVQPIMDHVV